VCLRFVVTFCGFTFCVFTFYGFTFCVFTFCGFTFLRFYFSRRLPFLPCNHAVPALYGICSGNASNNLEKIFRLRPRPKKKGTALPQETQRSRRKEGQKNNPFS
jgi:hypothetical protein